MKRVLIISPRFAPVNAADMQRVRMSLPYFAGLGWQADVICVDERYVDMNRDDLLTDSIPPGIKIHKVKALSKKWTSKIGLGSLGLRSLWFFKRKVNSLLKKERYDLIYFSTTEFPVCILGAYWKKRFGVPYVIDVQDPWHSDYYEDKPKSQRPPKYWFSYRLNKYMEPMAMKHVDGLISVSAGYIDVLKQRYPQIKNVPSATIPFGSFRPDMDTANAYRHDFAELLDKNSTNLVYVGRGGADMHRAVTPLFNALQQCLKNDVAKFQQLKFYFIGTSYAPENTGTPTILPLAKQFGIEDHVVEITNRISYYHALAVLSSANALFIPGSDDPQYSASKVYPYLLTGKPLLAIVNPTGPLPDILNEYDAENVCGFDDPQLSQKTMSFLIQLAHGRLPVPHYSLAALDKYDAQNTTKLQCLLFEKILAGQPNSTSAA